MHLRASKKSARISSKFHEFVYKLNIFFVFTSFMIYCRLFDMNAARVKDVPDEDSLSLYAVLNVWEPPRRLSRSAR